MPNILDKFTMHFKNVLAQAQLLAKQNKHNLIKPKDILFSLAQQKGSMAAEILSRTNLKKEIKKDLPPLKLKEATLSEFIFSQESKKIIEKSILIAAQQNHKYIGTEHLLLSILQDNDKEISEVLKNQHINKRDLINHIKIVMKSTSRFPDLLQAMSLTQDLSQEEKEKENLKKAKRRESILDYFGTELTNPKIQTKIDPVVGREQEINRIIQILSRRTKNNPVLLGEPGVGKTAIIDGLAKKIVAGEVPEVLLDKKIYSLDLSLIIAGTMYRGEFETRLKQIIEEVKNSPEIILFIDEIHNIIGAGSVQGSMDAANILKPALARGEIRCIGATTFEDFKKYIEPDPALVRRFQAVLIKEPTVEESIKILAGIKKSYELHHYVLISQEAIKAAVQLSDRYLPEKFLPDKAIDLIDEAAARIKIKYKKDSKLKEILNLKNKINELEENKDKAVRQERFTDALKLKDEIIKLESSLNKIEEESKKTTDLWLGEVKEQDIKQIVQEITGVPLDELVQEERQRFLNLEDKLALKIKGQKQALEIITAYIKRARAGLAGRERPLGSFIFIGPSGVGKTETARVLAETVFGSQNNLIRIDMSEFAESFNVSRLIGAPAGYVGFKEGGKLTEAIRRQPYSVVLFDEIEKAHPDVYNVLLQVLENGHLTDATGKTVNFKNTIIILTSNLGQENFLSEVKFGFDQEKTISPTKTKSDLVEAEKNIIKKLEQTLRLEFINRIDKIIIFNPLTLEDMTAIVVLELEKLAASLAEQHITLMWNKKVEDYLARLSFKPNLGARAVRKTSEQEIEDKLADKIIAQELKKNSTVRLSMRNKKIVIS